MLDFLYLLIGLVLLIGGAELLVRGGGALALAFRVPVIVVGLTVVALGTSMPEIMVSITAATQASPDMALGNVMGSNIANIALVLGLAALVAPVDVPRGLMRREVPTVLLLQLMVPLLLVDEVLSRADGLLLIFSGVAYNVLLIRDAMSGRRAVDDDEISADGGKATNFLLFIVGLGILLGGADLFVHGAVGVAAFLGMDERMIGLTVVALGTSAPEAITAMVSARQGQADMAIGNSLGSNILNISMALGLTAVIHPIALTSLDAWKDMGIALAVAFLLLMIVLRGKPLTRLEGGIMTGGYVAFLLALPQL